MRPLWIPFVAVGAVLVSACSGDDGVSESPGSDVPIATGGTGGDGTNTGAAGGTGGVAPTGGVSTTGGVPSTGGTISTGGAFATGGATTTGGALATGGFPNTGGSTGGADTGGAATGGLATGGAGTGGVETGGSPTGGFEAGGAGGQVGGNGGEGGIGGGTDCPYGEQGSITYTLSRAANPTPAEEEAYAAISDAMDHAVEYYNCYTDLSKDLSVSYNPSVETADGNPNGSIRFGSSASMNFVTAAHEIGHTVGIGYYGFADMTPDGIWIGPIAAAELQAITGDPTAELHADDIHFWPYGLNYVSEYESEADLINHCRMVMAILADLGI